MVARRQRRHLVAIDAVVEIEVPDLRVYLPCGEAVAPPLHQLLPLAPGAEPVVLAELPEGGELGVRDPHFLLVVLDGARVRDELGGGRGGEEVVELREGEVVPRPGDEFAEVLFGDAADGIQVCGRGVVFGEVAPERLVHVRGAEDEDSAALRALAALLADLAEDPGEEVRENHARAGLDVLEGERLRVRAALCVVPERETEEFGDQGCEARDDGIEIEVEVVRSYGFGEGFGAAAGFGAGVLRAHVCGV